MKTLTTVLSILIFGNFMFSQDSSKSSEDYLNRAPLYDYTEASLNNTDTIPEFESKLNKLKITGTVFLNDGVTPAENAILYIYQHDENGKLIYSETKGKKHIEHRAWVKTDAEGTYTFYTFVPGEAIVPLTYPRQLGPKQIYPTIKLEGEEEFNLPAFMFDDDKLITKNCRKRLKRKGIDCILQPIEKNGMLVAEKNIILPKNKTNF